MTEKKRNVPNEFNLSGAKAGDWFLGCPVCWFKLDKNTAAKPICPECGNKMGLYDVTASDVDGLLESPDR